jgi:dienelactone hydrolase
MPLQELAARLGEAPVLVLSEGSPEEAARRGTVLVYHGLGGHKGVQRPELERLAGAGFLAVGVDAVGHGERRWPDYAERFGADDEVADRAFHAIVAATAAEVAGLVDALQARGWVHPGRLGLAGVSMGAYVGYGAALAERRLGAVVAIIGSPVWAGVPGSPHLAPERFFPLPLLSVTAEQDVVVPTGPVHRLHAELKARYAAAPERLRHLVWPESGHLMRQDDWRATWTEALAWFDRWLR